MSFRDQAQCAFDLKGFDPTVERLSATMGGVYREELTSSRLHANRFFFTAQEDEDPEIVREKARRVRALGLEPPRSAHFRQFARRQGLMTDVVEQAQTDVVVPRQSSPTGASHGDGSTVKRDTSEDEAK